jgi:hypothetical protein
MRTLILLSIPLILFCSGCGGADSMPVARPVADAGETPLSLSFEPEALGLGEYAIATVHLREPAPEGGAIVELSASDVLSLDSPAITIPSGEDNGTLVVVNNYGGKPKLVSIMATYASATVSHAFYVPSVPPDPPDPPVCKTHVCTK